MSQKNTFETGKILTTILITTIIVGGLVYYFQQGIIRSLVDEINGLKIQIHNLENGGNDKASMTVGIHVASPDDTNNEETTEVEDSISLCTDEPTPTDIGRDIYPTDTKYNNISFLGELFTASNCGDDRVAKIFGVDGDEYYLGSLLKLRLEPSEELKNTLMEIGYICNDESEDKNCMTWKLDAPVPLTEILRLEPYYQEIESNDCINCG